MVIRPQAREKAHEGPVSAITATAGRVWTCGGQTAFVCLREWTQRGEFMAKHDLKAVGMCGCVCINAWLNVSIADDHYPMLFWLVRLMPSVGRIGHLSRGLS